MNVAPRIAAYLALPRPWTLWTFIKLHEKSKDPAHCRRLKKQMEGELQKRTLAGEVVRCRSVKGRRAWKLNPNGAGACPF